MPFEGLVRARRLLVQGDDNTKVIIEVDPITGNPRIYLYSGNPLEVSPAIIENVIGTGFRVISPVLSTDTLPAAEINLSPSDSSFGGNNGKVSIGAEPNSYMQVDPLGDNIIASLTGLTKVIDGAFQTDGQLNANLNFKLPNGRRITGIGGNFGVSDNCSGGNGTLNYAHDFGTDNFSIIPVREGAANQIMSRIRAGDTSTTFQCRVQNNDGTSPANGTAIAISWLGISWAP